ncbi:MAG: hypothetical protein ACXVZJ_11775 [Terriglobales bacterium]
MSINQPPTWYHSNRYAADSACEYCRGIIRHERWCVTRNRNVRYAFDVAAGVVPLAVEDQLILYALGVSWTPRGKTRLPRRACASRPAE